MSLSSSHRKPVDSFGLVRFFSGLSVALLLFTQSQAQQWLPLGPFSLPETGLSSDYSSKQARGIGRVGSFIFSGKNNSRKLFLLTPFDRYRVSYNGGGTWMRPDLTGLPAAGISDLLFLRCGRMLAATGDADCILNPNGPALNSEYCQSRGIYQTFDNGRTWSGPIGRWYDSSGRVAEDFWNYPSLKVCRRLVRVPGTRKTFLALIHTCNPVGRTFDGTLYRSADAGRTWFPALTVTDGCFKDVVFSTDGKHTVYVGGRTVYRSSDDGESWESLQPFGLPADSLVSRCELAVSSAAKGRLYVLASLRSGKGNELFLLEPSEDSLRKVTAGAPSPEWRTALAVDHSDPEAVYFTAGNKVNRFVRSGLTWKSNFAGAGLHDDVHELISDPKGDRIYASTDGGPSVTEDGGSTWELLYNGVNVAECWGVAIRSDSTSIRVLAGLQDAGTIAADVPKEVVSGKHAASDAELLNLSWEIVRGGDGMKPVLHPASGYRMFTTDGNNNLNYSWDPLTSGWKPLRLPIGRSAEYLRPFVADPVDTNILYTGYDDIFRSVDGGVTWKPLGIPKTTGQERKVSAIAVAASDRNVLYVAFSQPAWTEKVSGKLYRSVDGGASWEDVSVGLRGAAWNSVTSLAVRSDLSGTIAVGFRGGWEVKMMYSEKGGEEGTWKDGSAGLPKSADVNALTFDPVRPEILYAATHEGVWRKSGREPWSDFNGNMPRVFTSDVVIDSSGRFLVAGTHGAGVWITGVPSSER